MVAANQLIGEVVVRDGASGTFEKITDATLRSTRAMDQADRAVERYTARAFPLEGALNQLVRAENALVRAQELGRVSGERRGQILEALWRQTIGAAEAERQHAIAMERARTAADAAQRSFNGILGVQTDIGQSARESAAAFEPLLDQMEREAALLQTINQERSRQSTENAQAAYNRQLGVDPGSGAGSAAASASVFQERANREAQARALVERHDMAAAAQRRYGEAVRQADQDLKDNFITTEQHQRVLVGEQQILGAVTGAQSQFGRSLGLTGFQMQNLSYQINDVVTGLAMGQRPMQVLLQQGGQIFQIFPRAASAIFSFTGGLIALGAVVGGTLVAALLKGQSETAAFTRAVQLTGNAAGVTAGQLDQMVGAAADASNIGASAARSIATQMVASGKIGTEVIERLLAITEDYAAATDQSTAEAGAALTKLYVDPLKGAQELDQAYNLLTDSQRQYIRTLVEQGRREEAQLALADAQQQRMKNLANELGYLEWAWNSVAGAASGAWDAMKGIGRPETLEEQIDRARRAVERGPNLGIASFGQSGAQAELDRLLRMKEAQDALAAASERDAKLREETKVLGDVARGYDSTATKQRELENQSIRFQRALDGIRERLAGMRDDGGAQGPLGDLRRELALVELGASDTLLAINALRTPLQESQAQTAIARSLAGVTPGQRGPLEARLTTLDSARHGSPEEARQAAALAAQAQERAIIQVNQAINDNNALTEINIQGAIDLGEAYVESGAAALRAQAAQKAAQQAFQQGADAELQARIALNDAIAKGYVDGSKQLANLLDEARAREAIAAAAGESATAQQAAELAAQIDKATRSIRDFADAAEAAGNSDLAARLRATAEGIGGAITRSDTADNLQQINEAIRAQEESIQLTQAELGLVGKTNDEHDITVALLRAKLELQKMNIDAASEEGQQYLKNAENAARLNNELRQQVRAQREVDSAIEDTVDAGGDLASEFAKGTNSLRDMGDVGREVLNELIDLFIELAYVNPLKNAMGLGGDTGRATLGTVVPSFLSTIGGWFGGGTTAAAAATPSAASIISIGPGRYPFENGGIMTSRGPLPLRRYDAGGIARGPQLALYGEGKMAEAYVPLPDGRAIDVNLRMPRAPITQAANDRGSSGRDGGRNIVVNQVNNFPRPTNGFRRSKTQEFGMASELLVRTLRNAG